MALWQKMQQAAHYAFRPFRSTNANEYAFENHRLILPNGPTAPRNQLVTVRPPDGLAFNVQLGALPTGAPAGAPNPLGKLSPQQALSLLQNGAGQ